METSRSFLRAFSMASVVIVCLVSMTRIAAAESRGVDGDLWSFDVNKICAGALLFEGRHSIGTEQGAVAVARDIRASTARRLARIRALREHPEKPVLAKRWLQVEQQLSEIYARSYVRIWDAIAGANSPAQRARLPRILGQLLRRPDRERARARLLEEQLQIPDCTGGENTTPDGSIAVNQ